jgi:NAD(P)-dependent dehydrogenase (short-subunit alcohol dehydrogenase family)
MNKKIIITGASQRIGLFLAGYYLSLNYDVIILVRTFKKELQALKSIYKDRITVIEKNLSNSIIDVPFWDSLIKHEIVGFIHCASTFKNDYVETTDINSLREHQMVNCNVFIDACSSYCQSKIAKKQNVLPSFIAFLDAKLDDLNKDHYAYTLSKLQLKSSIPFLAMSCAPHIRVNAVSPGLTLKSGEQTQEQFESAQSSLPFGFGASLEDLAQTTAFLLMVNSITGQIINVDAGQHLRSEKDIIFQN